MLAVGVNAIIGSSIFLIPGKLSGAMGWWSVPFIGLVGFLLHWVARAFALLGQDVMRNGGPYAYASKAFGRKVAFGIGWLGFICATLGSSTVGAALVYYFNFFCDFFGWPHFTVFQGNLVISALLIFFAVLNYRGALLGANAVATMAVLKVTPLLILLVGVVWHLLTHDQSQLLMAPTPVLSEISWKSVASVGVMVMFAFQGFEVVPVIAGEAKNPRVAIPWATQWSLWICALLYMLIQSAVMFSTTATGSQTPIIAAAQEFFGPLGSLLVACAGMYSIIGYLAGSPLYGPRYLAPLAEDGFVPKWFAKKHPVFHTPHVAIVLTTTGILIGCFYDGFEALISIAALTVALQYLSTSVSLYKLQPNRSSRTVALLSSIASLVFVAMVPLRDFLLVGIVMVFGFGIYWAYTYRFRHNPVEAVK